MWNRAAVIGIALLATAFAAQAGEFATLYEVTFDAPTHVHGELPTAGDGPIPRQTVSDVIVGDPMIFQPLFSPTALSFSTAGDAEDMVTFEGQELPAFDAYVIDIDLAIDLDIGQAGDTAFFIVAAEFPEQHRVRFTWLGNIHYLPPGSAVPELIGTWDSVSFRPLKITADVDTDELTVSYDGVTLLSRVVSNIDPFHTLIVAASSTGSPAARAIARIDRVRIVGGPTTVPVEARSWSAIKRLF